MLPPEIKNPLSKILLTALKCFSLLTGIIPLAFAIGYSLTDRVKYAKESIGADPEDIKNIGKLHLGRANASNEIDKEIETLLRVNQDLKTYSSLTEGSPKTCYVWMNHLSQGVIGISQKDRSYRYSFELYHQDPQTKTWELIKSDRKPGKWADSVLEYHLDKYETYFCKVTDNGVPKEAFKICAV